MTMALWKAKITRYLTFQTILHFSPDQNAEVLVDYVDQLNVGRDIPIQTVAYDCANHITNVSSSSVRTKRVSMHY